MYVIAMLADSPHSRGKNIASDEVCVGHGNECLVPRARVGERRMEGNCQHESARKPTFPSDINGLDNLAKRRR